MRKTCGHFVARVMRTMWETYRSFTQRASEFYNMGITSRFMSNFYQFVPRVFAQDFLVFSSGNRAVIPTFHTTNNVYNKGFK